jgi:hypothetical protein
MTKQPCFNRDLSLRFFESFKVANEGSNKRNQTENIRSIGFVEFT